MGAQFTLGRIAEAPGAALEEDRARLILPVAPLAMPARENEGGPHA